jgi:hypothetical protein
VIRYVHPATTNQKERSAIKKGVHRVLEALVVNGSVLKRPAKATGSFCTYRWKADK